jgi:hypothetical protein
MNVCTSLSVPIFQKPNILPVPSVILFVIFVILRTWKFNFCISVPYNILNVCKTYSVLPKTEKFETFSGNINGNSLDFCRCVDLPTFETPVLVKASNFIFHFVISRNSICTFNFFIINNVWNER